VCGAVEHADARVACSHDVVAVGARDAPRFAVGWRQGEAAPRGDLALPLRAIARFAGGVCVLDVERTLYTLEIRLLAPDIAALGHLLALAAAVPGLATMVVVESQPTSAGLRVRISWPTDRIDRERGNLVNDAWPARCTGATHADEHASPRATFDALARIDGSTGHGAIVRVDRRQWLVTEGDTVGPYQIAAAGPRELLVRRTGTRGRPRRVVYRAPEGSGAASPAPERPYPHGPGGHPQIALPPEPPAPLPPHALGVPR
jgi:hypothetical protein